MKFSTKSTYARRTLGKSTILPLFAVCLFLNLFLKSDVYAGTPRILGLPLACYYSEMTYNITSPGGGNLAYNNNVIITAEGGLISKVVEIRPILGNRVSNYNPAQSIVNPTSQTNVNEQVYEVTLRWTNLNSARLLVKHTYEVFAINGEDNGSLNVQIINPISSGEIVAGAGSSFATDCNANSVYNYKVNGQGFQSYNWQIPSGWSFVSGQGTSEINIKSNAQNAGGTLSVNITNSCGGNTTKTATISIAATAIQAPAAPLLKSGEALACANGGSNNYVINPDISSRTSFVNYRWLTSRTSDGESPLSIPKFPDNGNISTIETRNAQVRLAYNGQSDMYVCAQAIYGCGTSPKNCSPLVTPRSILPVTNISRISTVPYDNLGGVHEFKITGSPYADNEPGITYIYSVRGTLTGGVQPTIVVGSSNLTSLETASKSINVRANNANGVQVTVISKSSQCGQSGAFVKDFPFNNSLQFDGVDDYAQVPHNSVMNLGTGAFTFEAWINTTAVTNVNNTNATILSKMIPNPGPTSNNNGFVWGLNSAGQIFIDRSGLRNTFTTGANLRDGVCHHIATSFDPVARKLYFYVDGVAIGNMNANALNLDNSEVVRIGNWLFQQNAQTYPFQSVIDEVRIWKVNRTAQQINDYWRTSIVGNETGLIAYWKLNDGAGQLIKDFSTNSLNGTLGFNGSAADGNDPAWRTQYAVCSNIARKGNISEETVLAESEQISVYPNPSNEILNIIVPSYATLNKIRITDLQGKEIASFTPVSSIDVSSLNNGMYFLELELEGKTERKKIQIVR